MSSILVLLKPDAVHDGLCRPIMARLRDSEFKITEVYAGSPSTELVLQHYAHLSKSGATVLQRNVDFLCNGIVVILVVQGDIPALRRLVGATDPSKAAPGTIRREFSKDSIAQAEAERRGLHNVIHASDSDDAAARELQLWRRHFRADTAEQGIQILHKTSDGNDLTPKDLLLLQEAVNRNLTPRGQQEYQLLYAEVLSGIYRGAEKAVNQNA